MKTGRWVSYFTKAFIMLWVCGYALAGYGQSESIDVIRFDPPDPQPGTPLKLSIMLFPSGETQREISIGLITWTDTNSDCVYQADEEIRYPAIRVKDNDPNKDEEDFEDEILTHIYDVPQTQPPEKYTAIVTCGNESVSASINVPPAAPCDSGIGSSGSFLETLFAKWRKFPEMFRVLKSAEATGEKGYEGAPSLYVYSLKEKSLNRIARSDEALYLSPTWSPDEKKIACVLNQDGVNRIAWTDLTGKPVEVVTEGMDDTNPLWLPDNRHLIFLRDQQLQIVNTENRTIQAIAEKIQVDQIISVLEGQEGNPQIIYEASKQVTYENITLTTTKIFYLLELDQQFQIMEDGRRELVDYLNWLLVRNISSSGEEFIYSEKSASFKLIGQSFKELRDENIPEDILKALKPLENKKFIGEKDFLEAIKKQIGEEHPVKYGTLILQHAEKTSPFSALVIETVAEEKTRLFEDEYNYYEPAWSPDGDNIVFVSDRP